jgi:biopolymer transport protein ExbD
MARESRRRGRFEAQVTMNLTSLIDVVFILLIAFMIVAPALKHGLDVDLAKVEGGEPLNPERPVTVVITHEAGETESRLYLEDDELTIEDLRRRLEGQVNANPGLSVLIEAEAIVPTEMTLRVLSLVMDVGVVNYGFVTEPAERETP